MQLIGLFNRHHMFTYTRMTAAEKMRIPVYVFTHPEAINVLILGAAIVFGNESASTPFSSTPTTLMSILRFNLCVIDFSDSCLAIVSAWHVCEV